MRGHGPLHEGHLAEAVRRGIIDPDQREALLALTRNGVVPAEGHVPDHRWVVAVQAVAATMVGLVPGVTLIAKSFEVPCATTASLSLGAAAGFVGLGALLRRTGRARVPAAIFTAAAAPYLGGAVMFGLDAIWRQMLTRHLDGEAVASGALSRDHVVATLIVVGTASATAASVAIARAWRNGPVWAVPAVCLTPTAIAAVVATLPPAAQHDALVYGAVGFAAAVGVALASALRPRLQRDGVDGATWFELGALAPGGFILLARMYSTPVEFWGWLGAAAALTAAGVALRRWTLQLVGVLSVVITTLAGASTEGATVRAAVLIALASTIAVGAHWVRAREVARAARELARPSLHYWE